MPREYREFRHSLCLSFVLGRFQGTISMELELSRARRYTQPQRKGHIKTLVLLVLDFSSGGGTRRNTSARDAMRRVGDKYEVILWPCLYDPRLWQSEQTLEDSTCLNQPRFDFACTWSTLDNLPQALTNGATCNIGVLPPGISTSQRSRKIAF